LVAAIDETAYLCTLPMAGGGGGMKLEVTKPTMPKSGITKGYSP
jgi:hypothetical protein